MPGSMSSARKGKGNRMKRRRWNKQKAGNFAVEAWDLYLCSNVDRFPEILGENVGVLWKFVDTFDAFRCLAASGLVKNYIQEIKKEMATEG